MKNKIFSVALAGTATICMSFVATLSQAQTQSNTTLVTAIKNTLVKANPHVENWQNLWSQIEYFSTEVDLNNDGNKEVIVYVAGSLTCGTWECPVYVFSQNNGKYSLLGETAAMSNEAEIALLKSKSNGYFDLATLVYDSQQQKANWKLHKFDGQNYENTFLNLNDSPSQIVLNPSHNEGINLTQHTTSNSNSKSELPSQELVDAIRKLTNNQGNPDHSYVEYSFFEFDLNNDGNKDAIVYETGRLCGQANCYVSIFLKTGNQYQPVLESHFLQRYNAKVAILRDYNSGSINLAMPAIDWLTIDYGKAKGWRNFKFDGSEYIEVGESNFINHQTIFDFENAKMFNLANPGSPSQNTTALNNSPSPVPQVKMPDSIKLKLEHKGSNVVRSN